MSAEAAVAGAGRIAAPPAARAWRRDRRFFMGMVAAAALAVFVGFAPTYYLKAAYGTPALRPLFHLHGALFTSWIVLLAIQTGLVAGRRVDVHRRLGVAGAVLAAAMVAVGLLAAIDGARRGLTIPGGPPPLAFFAVPFFDMVVFAGLVGAAFHFRRRPEVHKRLMLLATFGLLAAAFARISPIGSWGPPGFFGAVDLLVVAGCVYDHVTRGRVHPAFVWGGLFLVLSQPLRLALAGTAGWTAFAGWLTR